jgi:hypothetical protein
MNRLTDMHSSSDLNRSFNPISPGQWWCYQPNLAPPFIISFYLPTGRSPRCRHGHLPLLFSLAPSLLSDDNANGGEVGIRFLQSA